MRSEEAVRRSITETERIIKSLNSFKVVLGKDAIRESVYMERLQERLTMLYWFLEVKRIVMEEAVDA